MLNQLSWGNVISMDIYKDVVFANLWANEQQASHTVFAKHYPDALRLPGVESARHAQWLFDLELKYATCPLQVSNTKKL